ncbi:retropepsin-like aspartic protease family protein [Neorickettsia findlayensis]|uniref:TIGR02281 family clan AA aspartic protease n=1 Tax=Neorickettsia findlayensis TaxID=2686014 RepID=A0A6P1G9P5_9RICK|nr:TIGR02281 family clan AA aspartic protease [Neorickettsia findlayensis]QHD65186.1 TIGR02281 family clan AA aspartic protease [Neorickettsia findlayensis]
MEFVYLLVILAVFFFIYQRTSSRLGSGGLASLLVWGIVICVVVSIYNAGDRIFQNKLLGEIYEKVQTGISNEQVGFRKARDGHFYVDIIVGGVKLKCLVDTGASDTVLSQKDAMKLGIDPGVLNYSKEYSTANGKIRAAPVILRDVYLSSYYIPHLEVSVSAVREQEKSLLGMSFLKHFDFFIKKDILFLLQK